MVAETEMNEYLAEIRKEVCSRCVERPYGGPPCGPLGKACGVELHLADLVKSVQEVHAGMIAPYLENNRNKICQTCPQHHHADFCPCPMDTLAVLVVEAIEAVDARRRLAKRQQVFGTLRDSYRPGIAEIARVYEEAIGKWTGCDWPTVFGREKLDLQGVTADKAEKKALALLGAENAWEQADWWLREVERRAEQAQTLAGLAVAAAEEGNWREAVANAHQAWTLEFSTGRLLRHYPPTWLRLYEVIEDAATSTPHPGNPVEVAS